MRKRKLIIKKILLRIGFRLKKENKPAVHEEKNKDIDPSGKTKKTSTTKNKTKPTQRLLHPFQLKLDIEDVPITPLPSPSEWVQVDLFNRNTRHKKTGK